MGREILEKRATCFTNDMFFVVSTGRSGTTTVAQILDQLDCCESYHEPSPELILESSAYHYKRFPKEKLQKILLRTRGSRDPNLIYCESNQTLSLIIPVLSEAFPRARYIWLIRNGLDVVASAFQKQWYTGHSENHDRYEDCPPLEKAWIDGRLRADRTGDMTPEEWADLDRFSKCCWYWTYVNRIIEQDLNKYAHDRYYFLRLEELDEKIGDLMKWMRLEITSMPSVEKHNIAKRTPYHWWEWTDKDWQHFNCWCGEIMDRYYPTWRIFTQKSRSFLREQTAELKELKKSWSWRITLPLRKIKKLLK